MSAEKTLTLKVENAGPVLQQFALAYHRSLRESPAVKVTKSGITVACLGDEQAKEVMEKVKELPESTLWMSESDLQYSNATDGIDVVLTIRY